MFKDFKDRAERELLESVRCMMIIAYVSLFLYNYTNMRDTSTFSIYDLVIAWVMVIAGVITLSLSYIRKDLKWIYYTTFIC